MKSALEEFVVDQEGKKKSVILPVAKYQRLLEDLHDLAVVAERRHEKPISFDEMKHRLKSHARL